MLTRTVLFLTASSLCGADRSSYTNPQGTSFTVPLTNSYSAPAPAHAVPFSVSGDDLERSSDLSGSASRYRPLTSYTPLASSAPAPVYNPKAEEKSGTEVAAAPAAVAAASSAVDSSLSRSDQAPAADYAAPAVSTDYAAPAPASTGNLYYYYYPVQAQPIVTEKNDEDELDPLVVILLPITVLVGFLALLSIVNVTFTNGRSEARSMARENNIESIKSQIDVMLERYYTVLESDQCMDRVVCELGTKATGLSGTYYLLKAVEYLIPESYTTRVSTFKTAVQEGYDKEKCKKFSCDAEHLIEVTRRK